MNDLNALRVFLTLMQTNSTSRAAIKLGRSQSYISKILSQLRDELDDPLFIRSAEGLTPTSYALAIAPKLASALEQVSIALEPTDFEPRKLDKITLHIIEPYLVNYGRAIIQAIRKQTDAEIHVRTWGEHSESLILEGEVDIGLHIFSDKPQSFYQKRLHSGSGVFTGNIDAGQYVKYAVSGVNDSEDLFTRVDPTIRPALFVDNYQLMSQLMDEFYTLKYIQQPPDGQLPDLSLEISLIIKSSRRYAGKTQWLADLIESVLSESEQ